jgi:hypothetical protein
MDDALGGMMQLDSFVGLSALDLVEGIPKLFLVWTYSRFGIIATALITV